MIDCRAEQADLRLAAEQEALQIEQARQALLTDRPTRLSDFERLDPKTFGLLLDLLGHAVASQTALGDPVEATSSDGGLSIHLQPLGQETRAALRTSWGTLRGRDCLVSIRETHATGVSHDA